MIELDGSEGGGSLVRTALTLSVLSGEPVQIENIRGGRSNPGLRPQHLAAVRVLAEVCDADVTGAALDARSISFSPGNLEGGLLEVDIGTAGSTTLLFDAVLPLAVGLEAPLTVAATGGTDVKWSPSAAYFEHAKLPLLERFGLNASVTFERTGFYPAGGGQGRLRLEPSSLRPLRLTERGSFRGARIDSKASRSLESRSVAARQADAAAAVLADRGLETRTRSVRSVDTHSTGSAIGVRLAYDHTVAGFDALGERGTSAEDVGRAAAREAVAFHESDAAVDEHMADQLLVFLALAGGMIAIPRRTEHVETGRALLEAFGVSVAFESRADGPIVARTVDPEGGFSIRQ